MAKSKKAVAQKKGGKAKSTSKAKPKPVFGDLRALESEAAQLESRIAAVRKAVFANEAALKAKIAEKIRLDDELNALLRRAFAEEKAFLSKIKCSAKKEEAGLKEQIASLERVNKVFEAKRNKIFEAKKRQLALKKQLQELEKQAEVLGPYA